MNIIYFTIHEKTINKYELLKINLSEEKMKINHSTIILNNKSLFFNLK